VDVTIAPLTVSSGYSSSFLALAAGWQPAANARKEEAFLYFKAASRHGNKNLTRVTRAIYAVFP